MMIEIARLLRESRRSEVPGGSFVPVGATTVEVAGYADASEAAAGRALVNRVRAEAAAALLRLNGVPADAGGTATFGAMRPLVPAVGAEPQNRRVEFRYE